MAIHTADVMSGVIEPYATQVINLHFCTMILNRIRIPMYIKLEGTPMPVLITLQAESIGPIVDVDRKDIDFNAVEVLEDVKEKLTIKNASRIDAEYTAFTKTKDSIFKVVQRHGVLKPGENKVIDVICNADEVQRFQDTLHIIINNGSDLEVTLKARGVGSTLFCKQGLSTIDFGTEYTYKNIPK
jgi:hydrocephalus-inducing protein